MSATAPNNFLTGILKNSWKLLEYIVLHTVSCFIQKMELNDQWEEPHQLCNTKLWWKWFVTLTSRGSQAMKQCNKKVSYSIYRCNLAFIKQKLELPSKQQCVNIFAINSLCWTCKVVLLRILIVIITVICISGSFRLTKSIQCINWIWEEITF